MMKFASSKGSSRRRLAGVGVLALGLTLGLSACDDALDVTDPDRVNPETLKTEDALPVLVASAIGEFQIAYNGGTGFAGASGGDGFVSMTATFTDELMGAGTFPTRTRMDQRDWFDVFDGNTSDVAYVNLHQARRAALFAQQQLDLIEGTRGDDWALMRALEAYTYVSLGEFYCGAVPFTELDESGVVIEESRAPLSTSDMFTRAITRFEDAIAADPSLDMARIGKARAQLHLGQASAAASTVAGVPTDYIHFIEHGSTDSRQNNGMEALFDAGRYTISDVEGINGLPFRSANDMRVPFILKGNNGDFGFDFTTLEFRSLKYPEQDADLVLADGVEARLIEAEAAITSDFPAALTILNDLRADAQEIMESRVVGFANLDANFGYVFPPALAPLTDPGTDAARLDLIMSERAFWLFLTGHRQGDLRRLVVNYGRMVDSTYPTGVYSRQGGGLYGSDVLAQVDFDEGNNPQFDNSLCETNSF
ncbi:MAG: hypothetical protein IH968_16415 [Gemmatimonadetes bacterium]|nr:hypothetical protein [Gemmatimonadota bacterium]